MDLAITNYDPNTVLALAPAECVSSTILAAAVVAAEGSWSVVDKFFSTASWARFSLDKFSNVYKTC